MEESWDTVVTCPNGHQNPLKDVHFVGTRFWCLNCGAELEPPGINPFELDKKEVEEMNPPATCETESCEREPRHKTAAVVEGPDPSSDKHVQVVKKYRCEPCRRVIEETYNLPMAVFESMSIDAYRGP